MSIVTVLGEGAFGTALALLLARNGHSVRWWCYNHEVYRHIKEKRSNSSAFPSIKIPESITPFNDIARAIQNSSYIVEAIPTKFLRSVAEHVQQNGNKEQAWVILSKGIEQDTLLLPSQIIDDVCGTLVKKVVISGPSYAHDIIENQNIVANVAGSDAMITAEIIHLFKDDTFHLIACDDMLGMQICGALKNCIALLIGMLDGASYSESTQAAMLTYAFKELKYAVCALGGKENTVDSFAGIGDLVLTAYGKSRNRTVGHRLGEGEKLEAILASMHAVPESITTLKAVQQLCIQKNLQLPLLQGIYKVVFENKPVEQLFKIPLSILVRTNR